MIIPPLTHLRVDDTCRLLSTKYVDEPVLTTLASGDPDDLSDLFDLESATNTRLRGEVGLLPGISVDELVFGVPNFQMINAAFTYASPFGARFNGPDRGAWYAGLDQDTALAEVVFHRSWQLSELNYWYATVDYLECLADFNHQFHDLRDPVFDACLNPLTYTASQAMAERLMHDGSLGVVYPSVRRPGGTNVACFRPALVGNVRRGTKLRIEWAGQPEPEVTVLSAGT